MTLKVKARRNKFLLKPINEKGFQVETLSHCIKAWIDADQYFNQSAYQMID
jgi:hypothetical protein